MCVTTKAGGWLGPLDGHQRATRCSMTRRARASGRINLTLVRDVREPEQPLSMCRALPAHRTRVRSVMALAARRLGRHGRRRVARRDAGVTTLAEWKESLVAFVRERRHTPLASRHRREHRECNRRFEQAPHGGIPGRAAVPGSRPTVQSRRTENRRWLQSGPAAPSVRWWS